MRTELNHADIDRATRALVSLGFSGFEAAVYVRLLAEPEPVTGYKIAQRLGKPVANTYKALESLANKGAVVTDEGASRLCRAVPAEELLAKLECGFREHRQSAAQSLATIGRPRTDDRVYQLRTSGQVAERCRTMLRGCRRVALIDAFPVPLRVLAPELVAAAARGVRVVLKAYAPTTLHGVTVFVDPEGPEVLTKWPGQWINLVTDGAETMLAFLTGDGRRVHQAVVTSSAYLSCVLHSAVLAEAVLAGVEEQLARGDAGAARTLLHEYSSVHTVRGLGNEALLHAFKG
ncbi:MAG TPA: helix-turn-helix domain-containing protein [Vicinamibacterales bacterium]|nr:helix-turn-helix domain-containing protein [Vicinamibacterales bacterium]